MYDYNTRKIYYESEKDKWEYLDPKNADNGKFNSRTMASAELAFYWAYNVSFYDKPVSWIAQQYIEEGKGTFESLR